MLISSLTHRRKDTSVLWLVSGILLIVAPINYIFWKGGGYSVDWWESFREASRHFNYNLTEYTFGIGVIAPFIAGSLAILGSIIRRIIKKGVKVAQVSIKRSPSQNGMGVQ